MLLRARLILPLTAPPVEDGAVLFSRQRIEFVGRYADLRPHVTGEVTDLGEVVLLPGLVNAHCHLDYTHFSGKLPCPRSFTEWIQAVLALKAQWSFSEYAASWIAGAHQLLEGGCTTAFDFEAVPELLPDAWNSTALRVISAFEMTGVRSTRAPSDIVRETLDRALHLPRTRHSVALAPHAPYSTRPELLRLCAEAAKTHGLPTSIHVAESAEEFEMFYRRSGRMHDWLRPQRDMSDCGYGTPLARVAEAGLLRPSTLVAHANYLADTDVHLLARSGSSVVHCPRSHAYFGHRPFPLDDLRRAGVPVCLGTDSLLTVTKVGRAVPRLDFLTEMALALETLPGVSPLEVLQMGTTLGARAVGRAGDLGEIRAGALADLMMVPFQGRSMDAPEAVIRHAGPVSGLWVEGCPVLPPEWTRLGRAA